MLYNSPKYKHQKCSIYRGAGGSGDATADSSSEALLIRELAVEAQADADAAAASATSASGSASSASTSATNAANSATNAASSATSASNSASAASTSASNASTSATAAQTAETAAELAETNAETAETNAAASASSASTSATTATTQATNASNSASAAATSATNASNSASAAATSATNAASSATSASGSATSAASSAASASTSETNAAASATSAASSASTATTQAGIATTQATNAATSATNAAVSASSASTSASNASTSASSAASAQSAAETARDQTLAAFDSFDDRYLGQKSTAPTVDNDGNALVAGALYFNTTSNEMKVWDGSQWLNAYASLSGALLATNNLSDLNNVSTARTNLGLGTAATTASTDYATAAQGTKADSALQPASIGSSVQAWDGDLDAIAAISGTSGLLKKTAANTWTVDTNTYLTSAVTSVSGTSPIVSSGGTTPSISIPAATASVNGYMTSTYASKLDGIAAGATNVTNNNQIANGAGYITSGGRAYPRRSDGGDLNFFWSGQSGQPPWLWGGVDGVNMYVYNPSNFSVNYATTAGNGVTATTGSPPYYGARAWVSSNNGSIRASANVSSVSRTGTGAYTVNFSTVMPDVNYSVVGLSRRGNTDNNSQMYLPLSGAYSTTACQVFTGATSQQGTGIDSDIINVVIFR